MNFSKSFLAAIVLCSAANLSAQKLDDATRAKVESAIQKVMQDTRVPSAQVGIVQGGRIVYSQAFGDARLPASGVQEKLATPEMHYAIGSISKQFTAACVLLLVEQGKMKLDDPVGKWFPELTRANDVTVRNLLTHTSGYSDYAPQDYTIPEWTRPGVPLETVRKWAGKPLDFEPGTKWQYSNTNFVLAGLIVEKVSGMSFHDFLWKNVIEPLHLKNVIDLDSDRKKLEPTGYMQFAMGPLRPAIPEATGWYFADGQLAMPATTLLAWDISLMHRTLLKPESYDEMFTEYKLKDGSGSHYGLGVQVSTRNGRDVIAHSGEIGGFVANNVTFPKDDVAITVLTNQEASSAAGNITSAIARILLPPVPGAPSTPNSIVRSMLNSLQKGEIDRSLITDNLSFYFSNIALQDFRSSLSPLGDLKSVTEDGTRLRGGMTYRGYTATFENKSVSISTYWMPDGKLEQFIIEPRN